MTPIYILVRERKKLPLFHSSKHPFTPIAANAYHSVDKSLNVTIPHPGLLLYTPTANHSGPWELLGGLHYKEIATLL